MIKYSVWMEHRSVQNINKLVSLDSLGFVLVTICLIYKAYWKKKTGIIYTFKALLIEFTFEF